MDLSTASIYKPFVQSKSPILDGADLAAKEHPLELHSFHQSDYSAKGIRVDDPISTHTLTATTWVDYLFYSQFVTIANTRSLHGILAKPASSH